MDKNILIIASTSELAKRTIEELKRTGCNIYATSRHKAEVMEEGVIEYNLDIHNEYDFILLKEKLANTKFDSIVNFAGIAIAGAVEELNELELKKQFDINLFGLLRIIKHLCPLLKDDGKLVNISSMASYGVFPFISPYCMSKASADILLNSYAIESKKKVVSIRPGAVATKFWETSIELNKEILEKTNSKFDEEKKFIEKNANYNSLHAMNPIYISKKIASIIKKKNPKAVYNIGMDAKIAKLSRFLPQGFMNSVIGFALGARVKGAMKK